MLAVFLTTVLACAPPGEGPFQPAALAPVDVRVLARVKDAAGLRKDPGLAGLHSALATFAGDRMLNIAWSALAEPMQTDGGGLFDALLGIDATYMERPREGAVEWALVTRMSQATYDRIVERYKPAMQGSGTVAFGAQGLKAAWRPPVLVVGPASRSGLLDQVVASIDAPPTAAGAPPAPTLADDTEVKLAAGWPAARIEMILRTPGERAGTSVATATPADDRMVIRHRSRFARPPIHIAPGAPADLGVLAPFAGESLAVFAMNPWRGELDPSEPVDALLLEGRFDDPMRTNMGARQLLVVGERVVSESGMRAPSLGLAFEVRDPVLAEKQWDDWAKRFTEQMAARAQMGAPPRVSAEPGRPRQAHVEGLFSKVLADHPLVRGMDLCWMTLPTPDGAWQILATDRALLDQVAGRMGSIVRQPSPHEWHEVGLLRGAAMADHLKTWSGHARSFLPEAPEAFAAGVALAAELAGVAERIEWFARAPEPQVIESEAVLHMRPAAPPAPPVAEPAAPPPAAPPAASPAASPPAAPVGSTLP